MFKLSKKITLIVTIAIISVFSFSLVKDVQGAYTFTVEMSDGCDCNTECPLDGTCTECFGGYCCSGDCQSSGCVASIETNSATNIATSSVQLNGNLTDFQGQSSADVWFKWGETDSYGNETASSTIEAIGIFNATLSGLNQGQNYHFIAMAETANGTSSGVDLSFSTIDECGTHNIGGWIWSENIGWISMSCENCDKDNNSYTDVACGGDNSSEIERDYGIDMSASTGIISSGEVWSPNIGWISFDYEKTGVPPLAPNYSGSGYLAKMSTSTYELSGWARALAASSSESGGWDGWIKFGWEESLPLGWDQRLKLTIDHNDIDSDLSNFPVLVHLSDSAGRNGEDITQVFDELGSNSKKIAITESDGITQCYVEVEKWDDINEEAWLWVKIPDISSSVDTDLYLYYDNLQSDNTTYVGNTNSAVAEFVWDDDFKAVYHMSDGVDTGHIYDSTNNNNDGTKTGANDPLEVAGMIGEAQRFSSDRVTLSNTFDFSGDFTIEVLQKLDAYQTNSGLFHQGDGNFWSEKGVALSSISNPHMLYAVVHDGTNVTRIGATPERETWDWSLCTIRKTSSYVTSYWNGSYYSQAAPPAGNPTSANAPMIGDSQSLSSWPDNIGEVRISHIARSASWIKATKETIFDNLLDFESVLATGTVSLNNSTHEFEGYAWGGDDTSLSSSIIGWLSFNDKDYDGSVGPYDYQATTTVIFPPIASNLSDSYLCPCEQSRIPVLSWEADQEGSYIYQVQIDSDGGSFASPKIDTTSTFSGTSGSWTPVCSYCCLIEKDNILWNTAYDWRVRIKIDGEETWSSWEEDTNGFTTPIHCYPYSYFLCSYDEINWYDCDGDVSDGKCSATGECIGALPHDPASGQDLYVKDVSTCYNNDDTSFDAQDCSSYAYNSTTCTPQAITTSYQWTFENVTSNSGSDFVTSSINIGEGTSWTISATTTDTHSPDQECGQEEGGDVGLPLPEWQEIAPY